MIEFLKVFIVFLVASYMGIRAGEKDNNKEMLAMKKQIEIQQNQIQNMDKYITKLLILGFDEW